jgi:hypothetical protein
MLVNLWRADYPPDGIHFAGWFIATISKLSVMAYAADFGRFEEVALHCAGLVTRLSEIELQRMAIERFSQVVCDAGSG